MTYRLAKRTLRLVLIIVALAVVSTSAFFFGQSRRRAPDIVLISLDTLRRDAVGLYSGVEATPALDQWGVEAVLFENAYVPMPFTLPSHMSMFTGLYPAAHGVDSESSALSPRVSTLTERLRDAGYTTVGIHTNDWLEKEFGFGRGFDIYERLPHDLTYADRVTDRAIRAWRSRGDAPLFLFVHYMDPHSDFQWGGRNRLPYYAPPRFRHRDVPPSIDFCDAVNRCATEYLLAADEEGRQLLSAELQELRRQYMDGVAYLDEQLQPLLAELVAAEAEREVLVIVTSDHGEEFREHGRLLHSQLYDETSAVPLLVRWRAKGWSGERVSALVEAIDVYPTILAAAGTESLHPSQGIDLLSQDRTRRRLSDPYERRYGLGQDKLDRRLMGLFGRDEKLLLNLDTGAVELYDLRNDPGERVDVAELAPDRVRSLQRRLLALVEASHGLQAAFGPDTLARPLSENELRALRALGYLR